MKERRCTVQGCGRVWYSEPGGPRLCSIHRFIPFGMWAASEAKTQTHAGVVPVRPPECPECGTALDGQPCRCKTLRATPGPRPR